MCTKLTLPLKATRMDQSPSYQVGFGSTTIKIITIMSQFITGKSYWKFDGTPEGNSGPHSLSDFGLPSSVGNLDAAFIWGKNKMLYFFKY